MKIRITEKHKHRPSDYLQTATVQDFKSETTKLKSHQKEEHFFLYLLKWSRENCYVTSE